jgi:hypothetical protein
MCPHYDLWNSWFGNWQKYDPTSVIVSCGGDNAADATEGDDAADCQHLVIDGRDDAVNSQTGGADGENVDDINADDDDALSSLRSSPVVSPRIAAHGTKKKSDPSPVKGAPASPVNSAATAVTNLAQTKRLLAQTVAKPPVVSSPSLSTSGSGSGSSKNFDAVYAKAQENKMQCLRDIEHSKCEAARSQQSAEHAFQFQHAREVEDMKRESALMQLRAEQEFQARRDALVAAGSAQERVVRQKIEFEKNVASLMVADHSGNLADAYLQKCNSRVVADDPIIGMLGQFLQSYAPSNVRRD